MRICLTFYRTVAFPLISITLISAAQVLLSGTALFIFRVFWVKMFTTLIIGTYITIFRSEQFIFYNNLGYTRACILLFSFGLDFAIWLITMLLVTQML